MTAFKHLMDECALTMEECATQLKISEQTVYSYCAGRRLAPVKHLHALQDLALRQDFIAQQGVPPQGASRGVWRKYYRHVKIEN